MDITVSAADANRKFSELLKGVREGETYTVTSHGRPVATLAPVAMKSEAGDKAALDALLARIKRQTVRYIGSWTRDELYDHE